MMLDSELVVEQIRIVTLLVYFFPISYGVLTVDDWN